MQIEIRNRHYFISDILLLIFTPAISQYLGVNDPWSTHHIAPLVAYSLICFRIKIPIFYAFKLYRRYWSYASIGDMFAVIGAAGLATAVLEGATLVLSRQALLNTWTLPWIVPLIDGMLSILVVGGSRFMIRAMEYYSGVRRSRNPDYKRILVAGAGEAGKIAAHEIHTSRMLQKNLVGFVDDDPDKIDTIIHGVKVYGPLDEIPQLIQRLRIQKVIIAMPSVSGTVIRKILDMCEPSGVETLTMPGIYEMINEKAEVSNLRPIEITDLLRRNPVEINMDDVRNLLVGKRVLVTGAGGSIGTELCTQIKACLPGSLVAFGHGENSLVSLTEHLESLTIDDLDFHPIVGDIRHPHRLDAVFNRFRPEIVFHAAAHKHVPLMEENIEEAVTNNIIGTWNVVQMSLKYNVEKFVLISTDKAVQPVNIMGMTKQVAEQIVRLAAAQAGRPFVSVRFGNVLGSRGSVIPHFERQIEAGGPVTVTHPDIDRYFMTIPEAVQLVLQASALGKNGEVFILDMGEPVNITDLARDMIRLSGLQEGKDIHIEYTGLRPGERLHEHLFTEDENRYHTVHKKIFVAQHNPPPIQKWFTREIEELRQMVETRRTGEIRKRLKQITNGTNKIAP
jgi:FlaA1/EpsC-like NDP-sugar epimerase